jgi:carboxyl-terminal processing protease
MQIFRALSGRVFYTFVLVGAVFGLGYVAGTLHTVSLAQSEQTVTPEVQEAFAPLWEIYNLIQNDYIDDVDVPTLVDGALHGIVDSLGDQFSGYMNPEEYNLMNADLSGEIQGIGVVIRTDEETGETEVVGVLEGTPAETAGILPGDIFAAVDGVSVTEFDQLELATHVRGPEGTDVLITMRRGDELIDFTLTRARITIPNVTHEVLEGDIGYIQLNQFTPTARQDLDTALETLDVNSLNGLIFDLRNNPGGLLTSAIDIASAFIPDGVIVTEAFSDDNQTVFSATGSFANIEVPIVVLINEGSASASELVSGAMQDRGVATIIGTTSFGKGTVQTWHNLTNGGGLRITIARWLTPDGNWIHEAGITPDIEVEWEASADENALDTQMQRAVDYLDSLPEHAGSEIEPPAEALQDAA